MMEEWEKLSSELNAGLDSLTVWNDGTVLHVRHYVSNSGRLPIHIMSREHAPPHFHVISANGEACYKIERNGPLTRLNGKIDKNLEQKIRYLYEEFNFREKLIKVWNNTRPDSCPVGKIN